MMHRLLVAALALVVFPAPGPSVRVVPWTIEAKPVFNVGDETGDSLDTFGEVRGVARTSAGEIVVADRKYFSLRYFGANGRFLRSVGRQGEGPGEFGAIMKLLHCGDSLFVQDWGQPTWSVFSEKGVFRRKVTFDSPQTGRAAYHISCNNAGQFAGFGWEDRAEMKPEYFRPKVPAWLSRPDGHILASLGEFPGVDRWGFVMEKRITGTGPLPLGKSPVIAIGRTRAYFGTADSFAITVFGLDGKPAGLIRKPGVKLAATRADLERAIALDTIGRSDTEKKSVMTRMYNVVKMPREVPAYAAMLVDREDFLWVQHYPRGGESAAHWVVFSPAGTETATIDLPLNLEVHEIGRDYVLGVQPDLRDGVQHVVMYRLKRG